MRNFWQKLKDKIWLHRVSRFKFKDQPSGDCLKCKWNMSGFSSHGRTNSDLCCVVPETHIRNPVCLSKIMLALVNWDVHRNVDRFDRPDEGDEWKQQKV